MEFDVLLEPVRAIAAAADTRLGSVENAVVGWTPGSRITAPGHTNKLYSCTKGNKAKHEGFDSAFATGHSCTIQFKDSSDHQWVFHTVLAMLDAHLELAMFSDAIRPATPYPNALRSALRRSTGRNDEAIDSNQFCCSLPVANFSGAVDSKLKIYKMTII